MSATYLLGEMVSATIKEAAINSAINDCMNKELQRDHMTPLETSVCIENNVRCDRHWRSTWDFNFALNKVYLRDLPAVKSLFQTEVGKSFLVVGAGPSVKENYSNIKYAQEKGIIVIAVDRVYDSLKDNNISPDYTISVDCGPSVESRFMQTAECSDKFVLMACQEPMLYKRLVDNRAQIWSFLPLAPFSKHWQRLYRSDRFARHFYGLRVHSVVSGSAVDLALWMGASEIYTIGCELSWEKFEDIAPDYMPLEPAKVKLSDGREIWTICAFMNAALCMAYYPSMFPNVRFYDLSNGLAQGWTLANFKSFEEV